MRVIIWLVGFLGPSEVREKIGNLFAKHELFSHINVIFSEGEAHGFTINDQPFICVEYGCPEGIELINILRLNRFTVVGRKSNFYNAPLYTGAEMLESLACWVKPKKLLDLRRGLEIGRMAGILIQLHGFIAKLERQLGDWKPSDAEIAGPKIDIKEAMSKNKTAIRKRLVLWTQMARILRDM